jgi:leucyl-tRNA synthetase
VDFSGLQLLVQSPNTKGRVVETYEGEDADSVRLAYVAEMPVNWCPALGTVLANEEVVDGKVRSADTL